jgi:hypothetical protein
MALAACDQATTTDRPSTPGQPSTSESAGPTEEVTTPPVIEPSSEAPAASVEPSTHETPASSARPPADAGSVAACSGSDENRDFYASMAAAVDWTVYCPVLSDGWFVDDGQYRLAGGGWMEISYDGPGTARIMLRQGAFCAEGGACVPSGREVGETAFGDRTGALLAGDDGSWSVVVERGASPSWLLVVNGVDEASARTIAADLLAIVR